MRNITGIMLLALFLSDQAFSEGDERLLYTGKSTQLLPEDMQHIQLGNPLHSSETEAECIRSQKGKWCFSFDTPVDLYVVVRRKSSHPADVSEEEYKIGCSTSVSHNFMLARGVFKAETSRVDGAITKRYFEDFSFYDHHPELPKETTTDTVGIFYARTTMTTSGGMGLGGSYPRNFNKPTEDEKDISIDHVFNQDIKLSVGEEFQIYRTYSSEDEFISVSILFKQPEEKPLNQELPLSE